MIGKKAAAPVKIDREGFTYLVEFVVGGVGVWKALVLVTV